MKASTAYDGVEEIYPLIGPVPAHWRVLDLKLISNVFPSNVDKKTEEDETPVLLCNYTDVYYNDVIKRNMPFMRASATSEQIKRFTLRKWDVLFTKDSETADDIGIPALVLQDLPGVVCGYHLSVLRTNHLSIGPFLKYYFESNSAKAYFECSANGLTRVGLGQYAVDNLPVCTPPVYEQRQIAAYLNRETAKIDRLNDKHKLLIELLQEKRQAVISRAVTKGLDPNVKMKDSGVEWLGAVPEHWDISKVGFEFTFLDKKRIPLSSEERGKRQGDYPYYGASGVIDHIDDYLFDEDLILVGEDGANLLNRSTRLAFIATGKYWVNNHAHILRPRDGLLTFWVEVLESRDYTTECSGSAQPKLTAEALGAVRIPLPPLNERLAIANYIEKQTVALTQLMAKALHSITLMREHRQALISATVTGKIDVRNLVSDEEVAALDAAPAGITELDTEEDASYTTEEEQG